MDAIRNACSLPFTAVFQLLHTYLCNCSGGPAVSLPREVRKVCMAFLTESGLEGVQMQARDRLPPATEALAGNRAGQGWVVSLQQTSATELYPLSKQCTTTDQ